MSIVRLLSLGVAAAGLVGGLWGATAARAQVIIDAPAFTSRPPPPRAPDVRSAPLAWPRLDPGAVLCRTELDLERLAARRLGQADVGPTDCRLINGPTAVTILERRGPRTHVRLTDAADVTGWTDVWLPERAPGGASRQAGR